MEKYRLIDKETGSGDDSTDDESVEESCTSRNFSSLGMVGGDTEGHICRLLSWVCDTQ